ncbi:hypothetical protein DUI87_28097 [Hirundo rustica rustica]|uniref:Arrestin-C n=1 Tax=Hirundo rustica rustica TaxID=333673 RepID=A0A3M0J3I5_HIRRU|nr:hypothetical protein DUI87_28097 [Hirundo rustica rustica]
MILIAEAPACRERGDRVFKKTSPNSKLSLYLGKRDYVDNVDSVESVDGVCLVDPEYLQDRKVYVTLTCAFRYGRDDLDVIGLTFRKDIYVVTTQLYPPVPDQTPKTLTPLQEKLMKKLGEHAYPFTFEIATNLPCSITLQPGPDDVGKACGVDFEVKGFCAENLEEENSQEVFSGDPFPPTFGPKTKPLDLFGVASLGVRLRTFCQPVPPLGGELCPKLRQRSLCHILRARNSVRLIIRKIQFAPAQTGPAPKAETTRQFMMSDKPLHLEASLDKELYYHGEPIYVTVNINNTTNKIVKKIKISGERGAEGACPIQRWGPDTVAANSTFSKTYSVTPLLSSNRQKRGLALDGKLKHEDTNLASTTVLRPGMDKEVMGILVSYKVKVNLMVSRGGEEDIVIEEFARHKLKGEKDNEEEKEEAEKE